MKGFYWDVMSRFMRSAETMELFSQATVGDLWTAVTAAALMQTLLSNEASWPCYPGYSLEGSRFFRWLSFRDSLKGFLARSI